MQHTYLAIRRKVMNTISLKKCPTHTIMKILQPQIAPGNQNIESNPLVILQNCLMYSREKEDST